MSDAADSGVSGTDTAVFNGADASESISPAAKDSRGALTIGEGIIDLSTDGAFPTLLSSILPDLDSNFVDLNWVEYSQLHERAGADRILVSDQAGTGVAIDSSGMTESGEGDRHAVGAVVSGTAANSNLIIAGNGSLVAVNRLSKQVIISGADGNDFFVFDSVGDNASALDALIQLKIAANDTVATDDTTPSDDTLPSEERSNDVTGSIGKEAVDRGDGTSERSHKGSGAFAIVDLAASGSRTLLSGIIPQTRAFDAHGGNEQIILADQTSVALTRALIEPPVVPGNIPGNGSVGGGSAKPPVLNVNDAAGFAGESIALGISSTLAATDQGGTLSLTITGIPADAILHNAKGALVFNSGIITFTAAQLAANVLNGLSLTPATADQRNVVLHATATTIEGTTSASTSHDIKIGVSKILLVGAHGQFTTIQAAIDAAQVGDVVRILPGTYTEQVVIDPTQGHGVNGLLIEGLGQGQGQGQGKVTLNAPASLVSTGKLPTGSGRDVDGLITVRNASGVTITGLTVDGLQSGASVTGTKNPTLAGIVYLNASGTVDHVDVKGIREGEAGFGNQRGIGILASNAVASGQSITITNSTVEDFQKGGIVVTNAGVTITGNTITGHGATASTAENGIQVSGASGVISNNTISQVGFTKPSTVATGILFFDSANLTIDHNVITGALDANNQPVSTVGINGLNSSNIEMSGNQIANVAEGILGQEAPTFSAGVFAPSWSIGNTNVVINATQHGLDFEVAPSDARSFNVIGTANGNDVFIGGAGNDTFTAGTGNDTLTGGGGADSYKFASSFGKTTINNLASDGVTTARGEIDFGAGISSGNLWFEQKGNDLQIDLMGTQNHITLSGWYAGNARAQVQNITTADGFRLDTQVQQLVSVMATYAASNPGFDPTAVSQVPNDANLQAVIGAAWHH